MLIVPPRRDLRLRQEHLHELPVGPENVNGFPLPYLRERMYREYDRSRSVESIRQFLNIEDVKPPQMG
jgi:hypothetical protein